jgi:uncharacterized membrane protein YhaH (DUF805 family)
MLRSIPWGLGFSTSALRYMFPVSLLSLVMIVDAKKLMVRRFHDVHVHA